MIAAIVATLSMTVLGVPMVVAVDRRARGPMLLGAAFLYGSGLVFAAMLALSMLGIRWTVLTVTIAALAAWLPGCWVARLPDRQPGNSATGQLRPHWLDLATLLTLIGFSFYATIAPLWEWDFWAIWGMKARVFLEHGGIDWRFLESRWNTFVHPDYPLLVPFNFDFVALLNGGWSDRWLGVLSVAWAVALVLIVRGLAAREASPVPAALAAFIIAPLAASRFVGIAEGPLIAFAAAALLFLRRGVRFDDAASWRHGAILLGLAASVKNEGIALIVSVAIALLLIRPRVVSRLWPAVAIAMPWLILRATHDLPTDIASGSVIDRAMARIPYAAQMANYLARTLYHPWFWAVVLLGLLIVPAGRRKGESFILLVTGIQLLFYLGSYFATPHDPQWHIATSWSRLSEQIAVPVTFVVVLMLANYAAGVEDAPHAEARPVEP